MAVATGSINHHSRADDSEAARGKAATMMRPMKKVDRIVAGSRFRMGALRLSNVADQPRRAPFG